MSRGSHKYGRENEGRRVKDERKTNNVNVRKLTLLAERSSPYISPFFPLYPRPAPIGGCGGSYDMVPMGAGTRVEQRVLGSVPRLLRTWAFP